MSNHLRSLMLWILLALPLQARLPEQAIGAGGGQLVS
jgi:hypothetical protein